MKRLIISMLVVFLLTSFSSISRSAGLNQITDVLTVQKELVNPDSEDTTTAKTNYVAELNKIGMAGRSESDNAAPYVQKAIELCVDHPIGLEVSTKTWPKDLPTQQHAMLKNGCRITAGHLSNFNSRVKSHSIGANLLAGIYMERKCPTYQQ